MLLIAGGFLLANGTAYADEVGTKTASSVADTQSVGVNNVAVQQTNTGSNNTAATQQTSVNNSNASIQQTPSANHKVGKNDPVNNVVYTGPDQNASKRQELQKQLDENSEKWTQTSIKFNQLRSQFRQLDRKYKEYDQQYDKLEQQRKSILQQYNTIQQEINLLTGENNYDKRDALDKEAKKYNDLYSKCFEEYLNIDKEIVRLQKINKNGRL